ncbi:P-loop NTPase fold protein [Lactobacillus helsingborgensis]|uniref:P-loop NTPase fold protein n=1 Tax=Lactobacillus helsingborgensis TaxID=1218494 RepID=UPI0022655BCA|nr:P-loop NTPase fold protein [Lactobacillus helsingborgensis]UZX32459.1 KAP family NTPase [Lactobacillus helsingborgensis]
MKDTKWKIKEIDTSDWAKKFADLLVNNGNKTYFLQGKWGSGKTRYLQKTETLSKDTLKFIYLSLWHPKNEKSLAKQVFSKVNPILNFFKGLFTSALVGWMMFGSAWLTGIGIFNYVNFDAWFLLVTVITVIVTTLFNLSKNKLINVDTILMNLSLFKLRWPFYRKSRVLIIDDFDRLDEVTQKELYKLFNAIHEEGLKYPQKIIKWYDKKPKKLFRPIIFLCKKIVEFSENRKARIVFVGDWKNIVKVKHNYLEKIIDQTVSLPIILKPEFFGEEIMLIISENLKEEIDDKEIFKLFELENLTLRQANHFLSYVKNEFFRQEKIGRVQVNQQLFIIYLFLFHRNMYEILINNWQKIQKKKSIETLKAFEISSNDGQAQKEIKQYANIIFKEDEDSDNISFPEPFVSFPVNYFINDLTYTHSVRELNKVINNSKEIRQLAFGHDTDKASLIDELSLYSVSINNESYSNKLLIAAISAMHAEPRHKPNLLIQKIFLNYEVKLEKTELNTNYMKSPSERNKIVISKMSKAIIEMAKKTNNEASITELLYIYRSCLPIYGTVTNSFSNADRSIPGIQLNNINRYSLTRYYSKRADEIENQKNFGKKLYDAEALLVQLCFESPIPNISDEAYDNLNVPSIETKVKKIEQLADFEYVAFWDCYLGLVTQAKGEKSLNFEYKNEIYGAYVYNRYKQIKQTACSLLKSNKGSELEKMLNSREWFAFFLRIAAITHQYNVRNNFSQKVILNKLDQLLDSYKLMHLQDLLSQVKNDPDWVSLIK